MKPPEKEFTLNYHFFTNSQSNKPKQFSLSVQHQDRLPNSVILNALVGTLFKFTKSGKNEPYLAESFSCSEDQMKWKFKIRPGLTCDDGTEINATNYVQVLKRLFRIYQQSSSVMAFEFLKGYEDFKSKRTEDIEGLYVDDENNLMMEFTKKPEQFTEFLYLPHFGFWCEANLDSEKNQNKFVSSAAYSLDLISEDSTKIQLKLRSRWPFSSPESPQIIKFTSAFDDRELANAKRSIFQTFSDDKLNPEYIKSSIYIKGIPDSKDSLILNTTSESFFSKIENRRALRDKIYKNNPNLISLGDSFFYPQAQSKLQLDVANEFIFDSLIEPELRFAFTYNKDNASEKWLKLLRSALANDKVKIVEVYGSGDLKEWYHNRTELTNLSGAFRTVHNGAQISKEAINMIFCTKLGAQYPDPSGRICKLTNEYLDKPIDEEYIRQFNQILYEDAAVIPIASVSKDWLLTPDLDPTSINPAMDLPLFEQFKLKE